MTDRVDKSELAKYVVVANSPLYIIDAFIRHPELAKLAQRDGSHLLKSIRYFRSKTKLKTDDLSYVFALLVALYMKEDLHSLNLASSYEIDDGWYHKIINHLKAGLETETADINKIRCMPTASEINLGHRRPSVMQRIKL